jgi:cytochrome P450
MSAPTIDDAAKVFADPKAYADEPKLHAALKHLRANAPVSWVEVPDYRPFWAITKHADVMAIERANTLFTNSPRPVLMTAEADAHQEALGISTLIHMDDPRHRVVRAIGADWFRPKPCGRSRFELTNSPSDSWTTWLRPAPNVISSKRSR